MASILRPLSNLIFILLFTLMTSCSVLMPSVREEAHLPGIDVNKTLHVADIGDAEVPVTEDKTVAAQRKLQQDIQTLEQREADFNTQLTTMMQQGRTSGRDLSQTSSSPAITSGRQDISCNFDSAALLEVVRLFMDEYIKRDYIVYPDVQGLVTMKIDEKLTQTQTENLLRGVLQINNMTMFYQDDRWHIMPLEAAPAALSADNLLLPYQGEVLRGQQIKAYRLKFVAVEELVKILTPYLSNGAQVYAHEASGVVLVSDYPHVLEKVAKLITLFDVGPFAGMHMKVYWPKYVLADELIIELDAMAKSLSLSTGNRRNINSQLSFLALPRLNLLLTMSRDAESLSFVDIWVDQLDREIPQLLQQNHDGNIFIYAVQNGSAKEIARVLEGLFSNNSIGEDPPKDPVETLPSGVQLTRLSSGLEKPPAEPQRHTDAVSGTLSGEITVVVDDVTNAILVRSSAADYRTVLPVIKALDRYPKQALIEVTIAEIKLDETTKLGIEWQYLMNNVAGTSASGVLSVDSGLGVVTDSGTSVINSGLSYLLVNTDRFTAALKAFSDQNRVNILSSPHILASDNQESRIDIGEEVPIITSEYRTTETASTATSVDKTIQYRDVGVLLSVTPRIHDNGMVKLDVSQEVSEISNKTVEGTDSPVFSKRAATTTLSVRDGQTIVIAGLMQQSYSNGYSGVPVLGRIPILRYFFGYESRAFENTELMIFITPHVILNEDDSEFISRSFLQRLEVARNGMSY